MLSKVVKKSAKATIFGVFSLAGTIGILIITKLGGYLYDKYSVKWPFIMSIICYIILAIIIIIFAFLKKLRV